MPLGWPEPFREAIAAHARLDPWKLPAASTVERDQIALRRTDLDVRERTGHRPMSVAADTIGLVALRGAALCERLRVSLGIEIDRSGLDGPICEVYPGGLLRVWGEHPGGYGPTAAGRAEARASIVQTLERRTGLELGADERQQVTGGPRSDALDAVICAVLAGMVELGQTSGPPPELLALARLEGWIHLPPRDREPGR